MGSPRIATRVSFRALAYRPVAHIMAFKALNQAYAAKLTRENKSIRHLTDNYHGTINAEQVKSAAKAGQAVSGGMSVVHCGGPGAAGPPALDGGEWRWQRKEWAQGEKHVGRQGWRSLSLRPPHA